MGAMTLLRTACQSCQSCKRPVTRHQLITRSSLPVKEPKLHHWEIYLFTVNLSSYTSTMATFLSRHFLSESASCIASIPFAPGAPDQGGVSAAHNLLALGAWSEEAQEHHLTVIDLVVGHRGDHVAAQPTMARLAAFQHPSRVTAVQACSLGGGEVVLVAAGADGGLSRLRMTVPLVPGSQPDAVQLQEEDIDGAAVQPWLDLHQAAVTALDISADQREVLSTSQRGTIALGSLAHDGSSTGSSEFHECGGAVELTCCRWTTPNAFVTGSTQGLLQVWDRRQPGRPTQEAQAEGQSLSCLAAHPAQPHVCASGSLEGGVQLWDLRQGRQPVVALKTGAGAVNDVHYDAGSSAPQLVLCCSEGLVGTAHDSGRLRTLYREPTASVEGLCLGSAGPCRQLFCMTDQQALVFMANVL